MESNKTKIEERGGIIRKIRAGWSLLNLEGRGEVIKVYYTPEDEVFEDDGLSRQVREEMAQLPDSVRDTIENEGKKILSEVTQKSFKKIIKEASIDDLERFSRIISKVLLEERFQN